ncbi:MAG: hypothetical protein A2Y57_00290 [Candidatus Woykebacteria bacterium RBG_13_40_7b]|uniref:HicB-like antitoxin of toxin-antitoxin system domain-containing protein n=1 Tax=Candidatus Woykebacteria bacterium RBG_13_40_7b TaxID=1802594 RepID=A0A1G1WAX3_9BACT|nr:MAG: hypothetical protein A2Y57_00290 [Candidatus Woykebacteria bacterium RBG_13_40_7b]
METQVANYRIIIEPEFLPDGKKVYNAYCPTLEVADYGDSIEEVLESIKDGIRLAIECLIEEGKEVPVDNIKEQVIANAEAQIPTKI